MTSWVGERFGRDYHKDFSSVAVEHFYSSLATVDWETYQQKGLVLQTLTEDHLAELNRFKMRATFWAGEYRDCQGEVRREICNLAFGDLGAVLSAEAFVVNKETFHWNLELSVGAMSKTKTLHLYD